MLKNEKTAVIIASLPVPEGMRCYIKPGAFVVTADAGWHAAEALRLPVDLAVGDFDSSQPPPAAKEIIRLSTEKDDTDTHFASREVLRRGYNDVLMLGALGGRMDHSFANWQTLLYLARAGASARAAAEGVELYCVGPGRLCLPAKRGAWVSVFAAGGAAAGVHLQGLKYPLKDALLLPDDPLGTSNEFVEEEAVITCREGFLYVVVSL